MEFQEPRDWLVLFYFLDLIIIIVNLQSKVWMSLYLCLDFVPIKRLQFDIKMDRSRYSENVVLVLSWFFSHGIFNLFVGIDS